MFGRVREKKMKVLRSCIRTQRKKAREREGEIKEEGKRKTYDDRTALDVQTDACGRRSLVLWTGEQRKVALKVVVFLVGRRDYVETAASRTHTKTKDENKHDFICFLSETYKVVGGVGAGAAAATEDSSLLVCSSPEGVGGGVVLAPSGQTVFAFNRNPVRFGTGSDGLYLR